MDNSIKVFKIEIPFNEINYFPDDEEFKSD